MNKILLISPQENIPRKYEMYPSGALILLGQMLRSRGNEVRLLHMIADRLDVEAVKAEIKTFKPDIVGITVNTFQVRFAKYLSMAAKDISKNITVVAGGPHPSALKEKFLVDLPDIDIVVYGEGEFTFLELSNSHDLKAIKGICYREQSNGPRPYSQTLDHIPSHPDLSLIGPLQRFRGVYPVAAFPSMFIMASRGCPFKCIFCNKSVWADKVRFRKPEDIVEEIEWLHQQYGIREIFFQDDTLNLNHEWLQELLDLIMKRGLNKSIVYKTPFRADATLIDEKILQMAKKAGFWAIFYGVESGNQSVLDRMKKGLRLEEIERAFVLTRKVGLKTIASFMIGNPGETKNTFKESLIFKKRIKPDYVGFSLATPFPGTELRRLYEQENKLLDIEYDEYSNSTCVIMTDSLSQKDLVKLSRKAYITAFLNNKDLSLKKLIRICQHIIKIVILWIERRKHSYG